MNLTKTKLPADVVAALREFNIREVEALLSYLATPTGLLGIARILKRPVEEVRDWERELRASNPEVEAPPARGPFHPMGYQPPRPTTDG